MAGMNARLNPEIETVFLMASDRFQFISSRFVKEIGALGGDVSHFVSPRVAVRLLDRFASGRPKPRRRPPPPRTSAAKVARGPRLLTIRFFYPLPGLYTPEGRRGALLRGAVSRRYYGRMHRMQARGDAGAWKGVQEARLR